MTASRTLRTASQAESEARIDRIEATIQLAEEERKWMAHGRKSARLGDRAGILRCLFQTAYAKKAYAKKIGDDALRKSMANDMAAVVEIGERMGLRPEYGSGFRDQKFSKKRKELLEQLNIAQREINDLLLEYEGDELLTRHAERINTKLAQHCRSLGLVKQDGLWRDPHA